MRLRRLIADEHPVIEGYDEPRFARRLFYDDRPIESALAAFAAARATTLQILERLGEDQWTREGVHTESGRYGVEDWLRIYASHAHDHADQIRRVISIGRGAGLPSEGAGLPSEGAGLPSEGAGLPSEGAAVTRRTTRRSGPPSC